MPSCSPLLFTVEFNLVSDFFLHFFAGASRERRQSIFERRMFMARMRLEPPWETYYRELSLLFDDDPDLQVIYDSYEQEIKIYADDEAKYSALSALLPAEKEFGNVKLKVTIVPSNVKMRKVHMPTSEMFEDLFDDNPIVHDIVRSTGIYEATYIVFRKEVVQYYNDDIGDINGLCSTLYQDIAKKIFENHDGVHFCTDKAVTYIQPLNI